MSLADVEAKTAAEEEERVTQGERDEQSEESESEGGFGMFQEPEGFLQKPKPATVTTHSRPGGDLELRLVGEHSLWAHHLWNAGRVAAQILDGLILQEESQQWTPCGRSFLEVGAGAGLPSLVAALQGAACVVVSDYPDQDLLDNLAINVEKNIPEASRDRIHVLGHLWGSDVTPLLEKLPEDRREEGFDVIILSDVVFNHCVHRQLLQTCRRALSPNGSILVTFTHHRPWLAEKDLHLFELAAEEEFSFLSEKVTEVHMEPMFEEDPGDATVRATVHVYRMLPHRCHI